MKRGVNVVESWCGLWGSTWARRSSTPSWGSSPPEGGSPISQGGVMMSVGSLSWGIPPRRCRRRLAKPLLNLPGCLGLHCPSTPSSSLVCPTPWMSSASTHTAVAHSSPGPCPWRQPTPGGVWSLRSWMIPAERPSGGSRVSPLLRVPPATGSVPRACRGSAPLRVAPPLPGEVPSAPAKRVGSRRPWSRPGPGAFKRGIVRRLLPAQGVPS